jgi:HEPN domain-containing protein
MVDSVAQMMLRAAAIDMAACEVLAAAPGMSDTVVGFHAQQACEKCLKAVASANGLVFARTHDLVRLIDLLADAGIPIPDPAQWIDELNPYAVEARYGFIGPGSLDRGRTLSTIRSLLEWANEHVASPVSSVRPDPGSPGSP